MPAWLRTVARVNPLTYEVDALRYLMLKGGTTFFGLGSDIAVLLVSTTILVVIGGALYPNAVQ
jgi:ABC-2 type transport system permease protein